MNPPVWWLELHNHNVNAPLHTQVQAYYKQDTLGRHVELSVTQLYLLRTQPLDLPTYNGNRMKLLESFSAGNKGFIRIE